MKLSTMTSIQIFAMYLLVLGAHPGGLSEVRTLPRLRRALL